MRKLTRVLVSSQVGIGFRSRLLSVFKNDGVRFELPIGSAVTVKNTCTADIFINDADGNVLYVINPSRSVVIDTDRDTRVVDGKGYIFIDAPQPLSADVVELPALHADAFTAALKPAESTRRFEWLTRLVTASNVASREEILRMVQADFGDIASAPLAEHKRLAIKAMVSKLPEVSVVFNKRIRTNVAAILGLAPDLVPLDKVPTLSFCFDVSVFNSYTLALKSRDDVVSLAVLSELNSLRTFLLEGMS